MSSISSVAAVASSVSSSVASAVDQQTLAALQIQLSVYAQEANSENTEAKAAYQALQSAVTSGNVSEAQAALATLQLVGHAANHNPTASASSPPVDNGGNPDSNVLNIKA